MRKRIVFDTDGISTEVFMDATVTDTDPDVEDSPTGMYKMLSDKSIVPLPRDEYIDKFIDYRQKRKAEYPPVRDQLDEVWKILGGLGTTSEMLNNIKAVKLKHPKG